MNTDCQPVAVIFDLDGVLTDTAEAHAMAWRMLAENHQFRVTDSTLNQVRGRSRADSLIVLLSDMTVSSDTFQAMLDEKNRYYVEAIRHLTPDDLLPGAFNAVTTAKQHHARVAVGSASKNARTVLGALGVSNLFDTVVDGHDVAHPKPHPDVFLVAAKRLAVAPARCAVIEDASSGLDAARAAGMFAIGVGPHLQQAECDLYAPSLTDLNINDVLSVLEQR